MAIAAPLTSFYVTGGTLQQDAPSYVERKADRELYEVVRQGEFCYVLTSRQMGKSSLMVRTAARLQEEGVAPAVLDLTGIGQNLTPEQWYGGLLRRLGRSLERSGELEEALDDFWFEQQERLGPLQRWLAAVEQIVLPRCTGSLVIFIDEIDAVRSLPFSTDEFFAAIRECYNRRTLEPTVQRLTFCLLGVASPSDLIRDTRMTPFNIGRRIELTDFTPSEAAPLVQGFGRETEQGRQLLERVLYWTGGHPYLTQRLCQAVAADPKARHPADVDRHCQALFLSPSARERDDNLLFVRERLLRSEADLASLLDLYAQVWSGKRVAVDDTNPLIDLLRLAGLARSTDGHLQVRNRIYERVFDREWVTTHMPDAELRRQRRAYWRGVARTVAISAIIIAVIGTLALSAVTEARRANRSEGVAKRHAAVAEEGRQMLRRHLYAAQVNLAQQAWEAGNTARAIRLLKAQRPGAGQEELRGFEWGYLWRLCKGDSIRTFQLHTDHVRGVAFSADGMLLASGSADHTIRLWDVKGRKPPVVLRGHTQKVGAVAFSPDGRLLASVSGVWDKRDVPGEVKLWDVTTRRVVASFAGHTRVVNRAVFSPDGTLLATAGEDNTVRLWDVAARRAVARLTASDGGVNDVAFSPDGRRVAAISGRGPVQIWDVRTRRQIASPDPRPGFCLAFSPQGRLLAVGHYENHVQLWDLTTMRQVATLRRNLDAARSLAFSPDGRTLAIGGYSTVRLLDIPSALRHPVSTPRAILRGHADLVKSVTFSPDGRLLATGSRDGTAKLWNPFPPPPRPLMTGRKQPIIAQQLSATGQTVAVGYADGTVDLWDTSTSTHLGTLKGGGENMILALSADGQSVAAVSGPVDRTDIQQSVKLWSGGSKRVVVTLSKLPTAIQNMALSPDGRRLALGGVDHMVRLWEQKGGDRRAPLREVAVLKGHTGHVWSLAFSPNGRILATAGQDKTARLWRLSPPGKGRFPRALQPSAVLRGPDFVVAFSADSQTVVTGQDKSVRLWNVTTGKELAALEGHASFAVAGTFSPDGRTLATSSLDGAVKLWNLATHQEVITLRGHETYSVLAFSPDGTVLTSSSSDAPLRQWRAATLAEADKGAGEGP